MKLNGILGTGSGKLGSSVFSVVGGVQVLREYNPDIYNPSTQPQIDQRARLKLMAQVASAFQPINAFEKKKNVSSRNKFISANYPYTYATEGVAEIKLEDVQVAEGTIALPTLNVRRIENGRIEVELSTNAPIYFKRIVYACFYILGENQLVLDHSVVVNYSESNKRFKTDSFNNRRHCVIYAYGMRDYNAAATAALGDYHVVTATDVARLIAQRSINPAYYTFSRTRGVTLPEMYLVIMQQVNFNNADVPANTIVDVPFRPSYPFFVRCYIPYPETYSGQLLVDTQHFPYQVFGYSEDRYEGSINGLVGGEIISFVLGKMITADEFQENYWYSSQIRIAEQNTSMQSIEVNNYDIPSQDMTFVPIGSLLSVRCNVENAINMRLRMYVDDIADVTVPLEGGVGVIETDTVRVGDTLTFAVGAQFTDGFRVKKTFGGKVRITDETPVINSVSIRDTEIQTDDVVEVESGNDVPISIYTAGLIGAHVLLNKNGRGYEDTGITITASVTQFFMDLVRGDVLVFAVGWGETPTEWLDADISVV